VQSELGITQTKIEPCAQAQDKQGNSDNTDKTARAGPWQGFTFECHGLPQEDNMWILYYNTL